MHVGAERSIEELLDELPEPMFKLRRDPRVTRVGRVLRRLSLDEIPQLWNLLRGEMSLVGTRPEQLELVERYGPEHRFRLEVKPGMTGPMQVLGRGELTLEERLAVELDYVEDLSIGRDLRILALTPGSVVRGTGHSERAPDHEPSATVIVPTVTAALAARLLGSLAEAGGGFETILVDNGTGAAELERAASHLDGCELLRLDSNLLPRAPSTWRRDGHRARRWCCSTTTAWSIPAMSSGSRRRSTPEPAW